MAEALPKDLRLSSLVSLLFDCLLSLIGQAGHRLCFLSTAGKVCVMYFWSAISVGSTLP